MRCLMANLILLSVLFAGSYSADAQQTIESDTTEICIYFKCDHSTFDPEYRNNGLSMDDFVRKIEGFRRDSTCILRSVTVTGSASPDGNTDLNKKLAAKRAANIGNYLQGRLGLDESLLRIESVGIDWRVRRRIGFRHALSRRGSRYFEQFTRVDRARRSRGRRSQAPVADVARRSCMAGYVRTHLPLSALRTSGRCVRNRRKATNRYCR